MQSPWSAVLTAFSVCLCASVSFSSAHAQSSAISLVHQAVRDTGASSNGRFSTTDAPRSHYFGVMGAVARPGVYEWSSPHPRLADLVDHVGGLTEEANGNVRIIRNGRTGQQTFFTPDAQFPLFPGDVLIADGTNGRSSEMRLIGHDGRSNSREFPNAANGPRPTVQVALVNLLERPVVLRIRGEHATVPRLLQLLGQSPDVLRTVQVLDRSTGRARPASASNSDNDPVWLTSGTVLVLEPRSVQRHRIPDLPDPIRLANHDEAPAPLAPASKPAPLTQTPPPLAIPNELQDSGEMAKRPDSRRTESQIDSQNGENAAEDRSRQPSLDELAESSNQFLSTPGLDLRSWQRPRSQQPMGRQTGEPTRLAGADGTGDVSDIAGLSDDDRLQSQSKNEATKRGTADPGLRFGLWLIAAGVLLAVVASGIAVQRARTRQPVPSTSLADAEPNSSEGESVSENAMSAQEFGVLEEPRPQAEFANKPAHGESAELQTESDRIAAACESVPAVVSRLERLIRNELRLVERPLQWPKRMEFYGRIRRGDLLRLDPVAEPNAPHFVQTTPSHSNDAMPHGAAVSEAVRPETAPSSGEIPSEETGDESSGTGRSNSAAETLKPPKFLARTVASASNRESASQRHSGVLDRALSAVHGKGDR